MSSALRARLLDAVTTIRSRLERTYRDDVIFAKLAAIEEAANVEPIEAERLAIVDMLLDRADQLEQSAGPLTTHRAIAEELIAQADRILDRENDTNPKPSEAA